MPTHKNILQLTAIWMIILLWSVADPVLAQGTTTPTANIFNATAEFATLIAQALETLAFIAFHFLQYLLDPLFIMGFAEMAPIREIWMFSRDIMNVIFALILIGVGIFTVTNYEAGKALISEKYKKLILAFVLVNFNWGLMGLILDGADISTTGVHQLPAALPSAAGRVQCIRKPALPAIPAGEPGGPRAAQPAEPCLIVDDMKYGKSCDPLPDGYVLKGIICIKTIPWDEQGNTPYSQLSGLVYNYAMLGQLTHVLNPSSGPDADGDASDQFYDYLFFVLHILFVLVLMIMLAAPLMAMFVVFIIRIPILCVTRAFMPFMYLGFVFEDKLTPGFNTMDLFKHYVKAAFLPTVIAIPFTVGFILLNALTQIPCRTVLAGTPAIDLCNPSGPFLVGISTPWGLLILCMTFMIIWVGFWMAIKIDDIYVTVTSGIKNFGELIGKTAIKAPFAIPIFPGGKGAPRQSILGVDDTIRRIDAGLSSGKGPLRAFASAGGGSGTAGAGAEKGFRDALNDPKSTTNQLLTRIDQKLNADTARNTGGYTRSELTSHVGENRSFYNTLLQSEENIDITGMTDDQVANIITSNTVLKGKFKFDSSATGGDLVGGGGGGGGGTT